MLSLLLCTYLRGPQYFQLFLFLVPPRLSLSRAVKQGSKWVKGMPFLCEAEVAWLFKGRWESKGRMLSMTPQRQVDYQAHPFRTYGRFQRSGNYVFKKHVCSCTALKVFICSMGTHTSVWRLMYQANHKDCLSLLCALNDEPCPTELWLLPLV